MNKDAKIYVAGHTGMVGSAMVRELRRQGYENLLLRTHHELDLTDQGKVRDFFKKEKPEYVILAAALVGGIGANIKRPADFLIQNLLIECNVIQASHQNDVEKLLFLGSSCIYPRKSPQPIRERYLLTGELEPTNEGYALAKISGLKSCQYYQEQYGDKFIGIIPCNLYGIEDNFDIETAHIVPGLIHKFHLAKQKNAPNVTIWGSGNAYRELLYADDLARAAIFLLQTYSQKEFLNVGFGQDYTVAQIASIIQSVIGYTGDLVFDPTKPEGMERKIVDSSKIREMNWNPSVMLEDGIRTVYHWFLTHYLQGAH